MRRLAAALTLGLLSLTALVGCAEQAEGPPTDDPAAEIDGSGSGSGGAKTGTGASYAVDPPGPKQSQRRADVLISSAGSFSDETVAKIAAVKGVEDVLPISFASASIDGRTLGVAAVDPDEFRRFTPYESWNADFVWERLAGGEVAVDSTVSKKLISADDMIRLGNEKNAPDVHVGAFAPLVKRIQAVVNDKRGEQLGIPFHNAMLVSTGEMTPSAVVGSFKSILGKDVAVEILALEFDNSVQTALLTGSSVSAAVGTFTYTNRSNGEITPEASWVRDYIRTEQVPILGTVTCNKAMLPQLRAALVEIVQRGLSDKIHPKEYAGCYYPRYIGRSSANGLSLHSWGIAVDLNVPGNQRGTVGEIDRQVVAIFKKWGFAWGGDWNYTDPMHFELNAIVKVG